MLGGTGKITLTTKQFNTLASEVSKRNFAIQTRPIRMRKFGLFSMSQRYAYDKDAKLETRRIAVL